MQENPGHLASPEQGRNSWDREAKLVLGLYREGHREAPGHTARHLPASRMEKKPVPTLGGESSNPGERQVAGGAPMAAVTEEMGQRGRICRRRRNWVRRGHVKKCKNVGRFCIRVQVCLSSWGEFSFLKMSATQEDVLI